MTEQLDVIAVITAQQDQIDELADVVRLHQETIDQLTAAVAALQAR